jgi:predicted ester cyclase
MNSPRKIFEEWQKRQNVGDFEHLGEVVDLENFHDKCVGLSDWTTGYQKAFENLKRNILTPFSDLKSNIIDFIEGSDAVVVKMKVEGTHSGEFLGIPATGKRVTWEAVAMVKVNNGKVIENYTILDLWGIRKQLGF